MMLLKITLYRHYTYVIFIATPTAALVVSASAIAPVSANAMPVGNAIPGDPLITNPFPEVDAGTGKTSTGVSVPTVGADALLYNFK